VSDTRDVRVELGLMVTVTEESIFEYEDRIEELEAALQELRDEIVPNWSKREAVDFINKALGEDK